MSGHRCFRIPRQCRLIRPFQVLARACGCVRPTKRFPLVAPSVYSISYAYNAEGSGGSWGVFGPFGPNGVLKLTHETDVLKPSEMIGIGAAPCESNGAGSCQAVNGFDLVFQDALGFDANARGLPPGGPAVGMIRWRHDARWVIGFCDGHVAAMRGKDLWNINDNGVLQQWNIDHQPHRPGPAGISYP